MTDRDLILGLFEAVGALARRTTGDTLVVTITDSETGERFPMYAPSSDARWLSDANGTRATLKTESGDSEGPQVPSCPEHYHKQSQH
jgi:hypothetical protein